MRRYDDEVEVRKGADEDPEQFLWRGRLWQVREVVAHWVETGAWWATREPSEAGVPDGDLLREREVWRVAAARGMVFARQQAEQQASQQLSQAARQVPEQQVAVIGGGWAPHEPRDPGFGVFDLVFSWSEGRWRLARALD